jgi:tetratricopeptide (TPR) repeat protein
MKNLLLVLPLSIFFAATALAQNYEQQLKAFTLSYASEADGKYGDAVDLLKASYTDNYEFNLRLGWLFYSDKKYAGSETYYQKATQSKPGSMEALTGLANALAAQEKWSEANKVYVKMMALDPNNTTANYRVALGYYYAKNYALADKHNAIVLRLYPFDYYSNLLAGGIKLAQGKLTEAKAHYRTTLLINPKDETAKEMVEKL